MGHKNGVEAQKILVLQKEDGTWGQQFHTLSLPRKGRPITTEQALLRLKNLGFTKEDVPISRAISCMVSCLRGERKIDDYWEKTHDWELFTKLMLSAWIRIFDPENETALIFAQRWAHVIQQAFEGGGYQQEAYVEAYRGEFSSKPRGGRELDFVDFYHLHLLQGLLPKDTEGLMLDYVLGREHGIYYVYDDPLKVLPDVFASIKTSRYLSAIEILAGYEGAKGRLDFVVEWLEANKEEGGQWDLGSKARDNVCFPLSDSWRKATNRKADCTEKIAKILQSIRS